jgi:hypothetical protein
MPQRTVTLEIGINGAFVTRRWEEPDNMMRLTRECGYRVHEFCGDVIDPFFMGDREFQLGMARQAAEAAERYGVTVCDIYTGVATHRFHGLSHRHPAVRERMKQWIVDCMDIALEMGSYRVGGHWDALSVEVMEDPAETRAAIERLHQTFRDLADIAGRKGLKAIYVEQMYIPSEVPWTIEQAREFLIEANRGRAGAPVYLTIDVGHQAGMHYGLEGPDLDYREWLRALAPFAEVIHLQQTTPDASHHWAFAEPYNSGGHIDVAEVIRAIEEAHRGVGDDPVARHLSPVEHTWLIAEIIPGSTKNEATLLRELRESAEFLARYVPADGLRLTV